jgi:hypothetical protein
MATTDVEGWVPPRIAPRPLPLPPPTPGASPDPRLPAPIPLPMNDAANWLVYSSQHRGVKIHLTEREIRFGEQRIMLDDVHDVAFWSPKRHRYRVLLHGAESKVTLAMKSSGARRFDPHRRDYLEIVKLIEAGAFPRLLQARLQRIDMGLPVRVGKLELRYGGLRFRTHGHIKKLRWDEFDHVLIAGKCLKIITRDSKGRHRTFAKMRIGETNAVLLPSLLTIGSTSFPAAGSFTD